MAILNPLPVLESVTLMLFFGLSLGIGSPTAILNANRPCPLWAGKAPSHSNVEWLKRALGAAQKRDRSDL